MHKIFFLSLATAFFFTGCSSIEVKPEPVSSCTYEGIVYRIGEIFPAGDTVNTCECKTDGSIDCTEKPVPKNPAQCEVASDCEALDLETFCENGSWSCNDNLCDYRCMIL